MGSQKIGFSTASSLEWSQIPPQRKRARLNIWGLLYKGVVAEVGQKWGALGLKYRKSLGILLGAGHMSQQRNLGTENFAEVRVPGGTNDRMSVSGQVRSWVMMGAGSLLSPFLDLSHESYTI